MDTVTRQAGRRILDAIEAEMRRVGLWQDGPLDPGALGFRQPFGADTMTFVQWLQFVLLPRARAVVAGEEPLATDPSIGPRATREFDGHDELLGLVGQLAGFDVWARAVRRATSSAGGGDRSALEDEVSDTLRRLGADPERDVHLKPPATGESLARLQREARQRLGGELPAPVVRLLQMTDGCQIADAIFFKTEDIVALNLEVPRPEVVVLADQGNLLEYVFDWRDRRYHMINMFGTTDERLESFDTLEELLLAALTNQLVVP